MKLFKINGPQFEWIFLVSLLSLFPPLPLPLSQQQSGWWLDHIRYHAANPASAANQVANRTCPVGCRRTAIASWQTYDVPPDAAATQKKHEKQKTTLSKVTTKALSWVQYTSYITFNGSMFPEISINAYPFWQHSKDTCWCLHPLLHGRASQHLKHHPGWFYRPLLTPRTPASTNMQYVRVLSLSHTLYSRSCSWIKQTKL